MLSFWQDFGLPTAHRCLAERLKAPEPPPPPQLCDSELAALDALVSELDDVAAQIRALRLIVASAPTSDEVTKRLRQIGSQLHSLAEAWADGTVFTS